MSSPVSSTPLFPTGAALVTPSDTIMFAPSAIYCGNGGNVNIRPADGGPTVIFTGIPNGGLVPCMAIGVMLTSTTATAMVRCS